MGDMLSKIDEAVEAVRQEVGSVHPLMRLIQFVRTEAACSMAPKITGHLTETEMELIRVNEIVRAILSVRNRLGLRLLEAKHVVDAERPAR